jgi:hypothetical protein
MLQAAYNTELPAETRQKMLKEAVDCALDLFFYTNRRFRELEGTLKTELCELTLMNLVSHETFKWMQEKDILPKLTPIWEKGALRHDPRSQTDEFRKYLKDKHSVIYETGGRLQAALKEWRKTSSSYRWGAKVAKSEVERKALAEQEFQAWLSECDRGRYYLIRLSDAQAFGNWREQAEKEGWRIRAAKSRAKKKANAVTKRPKARRKV